MQGIYTYIPATNYVPRECSVAAVFLLLFMVLIIIIIIIIVVVVVFVVIGWIDGWMKACCTRGRDHRCLQNLFGF